MESVSPLLALMFRIQHLCFTQSFRQLDGYGIHPGQIPVLKLLHHHDGLRQKDLVRQLPVQPSTVTVTLQRMERAGLIERTPDEEDSRQYRIHLTAKAHEAMEQADRVLSGLGERMLQSITEPERLLMMRLLGQIIDDLSSNDPTSDMKGDSSSCFD